MVAALMKVAVSLGLRVHLVSLGLGEGGQLWMEAVLSWFEVLVGGGSRCGSGLDGCGGESRFRGSLGQSRPITVSLGALVQPFPSV